MPFASPSAPIDLDLCLADRIGDIGTFIDQKEGYRGGRPFIVGTGITVDAISCCHRIDGWDAQKIAYEYSITLPQVMAALTFYFANKEAIDHEIEQSDLELEAHRKEYEAKHGNIWDRIKARQQT